MTNTIKVSDVSVEKAIQKGLRQLGLPQDQVFVEIISEGKKGLFGFGQKNAEVELTPVATMVSEEGVEEVVEPVVETAEEVTVETVEVPEEDFEDDDIEEEAGEADYEETVDQLEEAARVTKEYLEGIAKTYGAEATVTVEARRDRMTFVFDTDKQGLLIGKHGKILNALQVLAQVSVHRFIKGRISVHAWASSPGRIGCSAIRRRAWGVRKTPAPWRRWRGRGCPSPSTSCWAGEGGRCRRTTWRGRPAC